MNDRFPNLLPLLLGLLLAFPWGGPAADPPAQSKEPAEASSKISKVLDPTTASAVTPSFVETRLKEVEAATDLDEAAKGKLIEQYRKALSALEAASALDAKTAAYTQALEKAPAQTEAIRKKLAAAQSEGPAEPAPPPTGLSTAELEQRLAKVQADAAATAAKLEQIDKDLEAGSQRPTAARQRILEAKKIADALDEQMALPPAEGESQALSAARRFALEGQRQALRAEARMLDQELLSQPVRIELLKAQRDQTAADLDLIKASQRLLEDLVNRGRRAEAEQAQAQAQEIERQAAGKDPLVQDFAQRNAELSGELTTLTAEFNLITGKQAAVEEQTRRILEDFRDARQRLEVAGLSQALGQVLLDQRKQLPDLSALQKAAATREQAIVDATLRQIHYGEERRRMGDMDRYLDDLTAKLPPDRRSGVREELRQLAQNRKELLDQARRTDEDYSRILGELNYATTQLMEAASAYDGFLSERLLWVRSTLPATLGTLTMLPDAVLWLIAPANWLEVGRVLHYELAHSPLFWLPLLAAAVLLWKARALRRRILTTAEHLRRVDTDHIGYTVEALGLTLLLAAPWPLLLATVGWQLFFSLEATGFTKAIGRGAISVSLGLYYLRAFRVLCMRGGVADRHFRWTEDVLSGLRRVFDRLILVLLPLGFVTFVVYSPQDQTYSGSLGRLALIALLVGFADFFRRILHPERGALHNLLAESPNGWLNRLRRFWYPLAVATPLALAVLTIVGYLYTAGTLIESLASSMYLVLGLTVVHQLVHRWLLLTRRRLVLQAAMERRTARTVERARSGGQEAGGAPPVEEEEVDLAALDEQTRRLVNTLLFIGGIVGLWAIWSEVLPAFGVFEQVALWHRTGILAGEEAVIPVTLADIGVALVVALIAIVAARNLPALLEILLLQRTSVSYGTRYTVKTLTGYVIAAAAVLIILNTLGFSWGQAQWLVAALGVGIGFGLQEIVANFISGIIVLFERPVRVGDTVTIGNTTGKVAKIRIRATTITTLDSQELLVPNKEFITGRLLNWSLSDQLNRLMVTVGVDYEADVPLAMRLLEEAAREHERVLKDPAPIITFEAFGDNALTLVLRCYLGSLENRVQVISALHQAINDKFRTACIPIANSQRDVHLSAAEPLNVRIHWPQEAGGTVSPPDRTAETPRRRDAGV